MTSAQIVSMDLFPLHLFLPSCFPSFCLLCSVLTEMPSCLYAREKEKRGSFSVFSLCPCMVEARVSSFLLLGLPFLSAWQFWPGCQFHYAPFSELISPDMYVTMVYMSRVGNYKREQEDAMEPTENCSLGSCRQTGARLSACLHVSGNPGVPVCHGSGHGRIIALGSDIPSSAAWHRDGVSSA